MSPNKHVARVGDWHRLKDWSRSLTEIVASVIIALLAKLNTIHAV